MSSKQRIEASTTVTSDECIYTWTIKNYRSLQFNVGQVLESPKFGVGMDNKKYFKLQLYPESDGTDDSAGHISFYLKPIIDSAKKPDKLICRAAVMIINNKKVVQKWRMCHDFATSGFLGRGWKNFFELEHIDKLISFENTVTIQCELEIFNEIESSQNSEIICSKDEAIDTMKFDFSFYSEKLSDVKLIVEEVKIPAHKIVLSAASPVFRAMFTHDMLENTENSVKITDITEDILTEMLRYIYTGEIDAIETDQIIALLAAADKYQIDNLKIKCGKVLCDELSSQNAIKLLLAAYKYKIKNLKDEVIKFVTTHIQLFSYSEEMKEIDDPDIWMNLVQSIIKSPKNIS
ncbi:protein roadkill-like [Trichogramma pretiosum]|uniref:protein roadkill-like n=1 Tax=Trichogramma pretiosum TaxID=7493 RepID=UPI0006C9DBE5|nr:protein roadkill-like [Trichogramma pretiosum]